MRSRRNRRRSATGDRTHRLVRAAPIAGARVKGMGSFRANSYVDGRAVVFAIGLGPRPKTERTTGPPQIWQRLTHIATAKASGMRTGSTT